MDVSDEQFPSNTFPIALSPDGDALYAIKGDNKKTRDTLLTPATYSSGKIQYQFWPQHVNHMEYTFSVLVVDDPDTVEWCTLLPKPKTSPPPPLAVPINGNWPNQRSCIGRTIVMDGTLQDHDKVRNSPLKNPTIIGAIYTDESVVHITWDGSDVPSSFDVLLVKITPKSLKQLCRNVIISATLAIPNRIKFLSLPSFLEDYCKLTTEERLSLQWYK